MKIVSIDVLLVDVPAPHPPFRWRDGLPGSGGPSTGGWLVLTTDDGLKGFGYCRQGVILRDLVDRQIRAELLGADPLARERLWHRMWELDRIEAFPMYVQSVVDEALWDLGGKIAGLPVHQLIGSFRDAIPAYASTVTFDSIAEFLDVADQCLALGYRGIKLHAWGDARRDAELCQALRAHVGDGVPLMYDGSAGFGLAEAIYLGHAVSEAGYTWYEEPMREWNVTAHRSLAERVNVPLLVGETSGGAHMNMADFVSAGCGTAVRTGSTFKAGITGSLRIAHLADAYLMNAEIHAGGLANRHLCMSIPNTSYYESLVVANPVVRAPEVDAAGLVRAPEGPGLGYEGLWGDSTPPGTNTN